MPKKKGVVPEKMTEKMLIRYTPTQRQAITDRASVADVCDTSYVHHLSLGLEMSRAVRRLKIDDAHAQKIMIAFGKWGEILLQVHELASLGEIPYQSTIEKLYANYLELQTSVMEMIEASR